MANIKSQIKRNKTNERRHERNKAAKSALKTGVRRVHEALEAGDTTKAAELAQAVNRELDKAVSKGAFHRNNGARKKAKAARIAARV